MMNIKRAEEIFRGLDRQSISRRRLLASAASLAIIPAHSAAQEATPAPVTDAQQATPAAVADAQEWQVRVNNVSPEGENWSFNAFYPDRLRAHPGDTIVFTLAPNPNAFHTVMVMIQGLTPMEMYQGFAGGFVQPDPTQPDRLQSAIFGNEPTPPCGRADQDPCLVAAPETIEFGFSSAVLVNPPSDGDQGNTSFAVTLDPALPLGPYYFMSLVDGPTMSGRIDVVAPDQPVQAADELQAAAERQYQADLASLAGYDRVVNPPQESNPDGTKTWQVDAGASPDNARLSINEFSLPQMVIRAGDTVTWTNRSPGAVAHTVSGFADTPDAIPGDLSPYQPVCVSDTGEPQLPPEGSFPPDVWNSCPGMEANYMTAASQPSAPSSAPYTDGPRTSGILLNQEYLDSPIGDGLPFASSYSVVFPNPGTYEYECAIHPGMKGTVVVIPQPRPF
jgi:plastocyanin